MRGGIIFILCCGIKGQGQLWHSACQAFFACKDYSFSPITFKLQCMLLVMRGGTLLILGHEVKGQIQVWHSACETLLAWYRLQILPDKVQTSCESYCWWEERPYLFWVMESNLVVNFSPLQGVPCFAFSRWNFERFIFFTFSPWLFFLLSFVPARDNSVLQVWLTCFYE